jgi:hypothetical protein
MKRDTLIEHKESFVICEESGHVSLNYNVLLTTLEANVVVKHVVLVAVKSLLTYTNCGKISHTVETCHNWKKKVPIVPTTIVKSIEHVVEIETQVATRIRMPIHYPYIIYSSV